MIATNVIASKRMRVGRDVSMSADVQKIAQPGIGGQEQTTQEFIEEFSCANQQIRTESMNGNHRKNLNVAARHASARASSN